MLPEDFCSFFWSSSNSLFFSWSFVSPVSISKCLLFSFLLLIFGVGDGKAGEDIDGEGIGVLLSFTDDSLDVSSLPHSVA